MLSGLTIENLKLLKEMVGEVEKLQESDKTILEKEVNYCKLKIEAIELEDKK